MNYTVRKKITKAMERITEIDVGNGIGNSKIRKTVCNVKHINCGSAGKESACNAEDLGLIPGLGRSPGEGKGYPLQYSGLQNSMDCIIHRVAKSWTQLRDFQFSLSGIVEMTSFKPALNNNNNNKVNLSYCYLERASSGHLFPLQYHNFSVL